MLGKSAKISGFDSVEAVPNNLSYIWGQAFFPNKSDFARNGSYIWVKGLGSESVSDLLEQAGMPLGTKERIVLDGLSADRRTLVVEVDKRMPGSYAFSGTPWVVKLAEPLGG